MQRPGITVHAPVEGRHVEVLTPDALRFVADLQRLFNGRRIELLGRRQLRQADFDRGIKPGFPEESRANRESVWHVPPPPADLLDRRVEITGPVERKMMINALNSGAKVFMADFEDALSPTWNNLLDGHVNLKDAINRTITFNNPDGRVYRLNAQIATLMVRPRGWHLVEKHASLGGQPVSGSLFDFGLHVFHNMRNLLERGSGPYFYLPKLENHLEARLWNDVFSYTEDRMNLPRGCIRATVLVETILGAMEMEDILYELREHSAGLNAGRWDYIFSVIKKFRNDANAVLPDRAQVVMTVPFMRAYTEQLVKVCHKRGAQAIGGMAAFIPSRRDAAVNAVAMDKVRDDKEREVSDGFDGTWVAHPDLVPLATQVFDQYLGSRPNQMERQRPEVHTTPDMLLDFHIPGGQVTEAGVRLNVSVGMQYIASWLNGVGAAAIYNLMEDAATAEISRAQLWQWTHNNVPLSGGGTVTKELVRTILQQELTKLEDGVKGGTVAPAPYDRAAKLLDEVALADAFSDFLTLATYREIDL